MNKKAYYRNLIHFKNQQNSAEFRTLTDLVNIFDNIHSVVSDLKFVIFNQTDQNNVVRQEKSKVVEVIKKAIAVDKSHTSVQRLFRCTIEIEKLTTSVVDRSSSDSKINILISEFVNCMGTFLDEYEKYRVSFSLQDAYSLSFTAHRLMSSINGIELAIDCILDNYLPDTVDDEHDQLELYLAHVPSLKQFGVKLQVLDEMYNEICNLCDFSLTDYPIVIDHIENGSLLTRISGHPLVVGIILQILGSSATYFITNYPVKNEIVEMKETVATLDDMFELTKKLKLAGYEVEGMQDNIHRTLKKMSKSAEILLSDQPAIEINEKIFELTPEHSQKLIEETKRLEVKEVLNQEA